LSPNKKEQDKAVEGPRTNVYCSTKQKNPLKILASALASSLRTATRYLVYEFIPHKVHTCKILSKFLITLILMIFLIIVIHVFLASYALMSSP
jgi:hypothetical protein